MPIATSELVLNKDRSIYHLNLHPEDLADTVITVGDPDRVSQVSDFFDKVELKKGKREFHTHTGTFKGKRISVISTGIGTDNIDIVLNELDALVNIDLESRQVRETLHPLNIIRIGTSGAIQQDIPLDSFLWSEYAIGLDSLIHFYDSEHVQHPEIQKAFVDHTSWYAKKSEPYVVKGNAELGKILCQDGVVRGFTATNVGFYGPQGRVLRLHTPDSRMKERIASFRFGDQRITNLEMETSGIYGMAALLGHRAASMNCILANRATGEFSNRPEEATRDMIAFVLERISKTDNL